MTSVGEFEAVGGFHQAQRQDMHEIGYEFGHAVCDPAHRGMLRDTLAFLVPRAASAGSNLVNPCVERPRFFGAYWFYAMVSVAPISPVVASILESTRGSIANSASLAHSQFPQSGTAAICLLRRICIRDLASLGPAAP